MRKDEIERIVDQAVKQTFIDLGIAHDDPIEMQKDFQHLREWRLAGEAIRRRAVLSLLGIFLAGIAAALWLGFKQMVIGH